MTGYDVAIVGFGAVGAAAALQLSQRHANVIAFDRFEPPHAFGSSHGETRVTRLAVGEGDHLTPLAMRSHELWREIERESGADLLSQSGALIISSGDNAAQTHVSGFFGKTVAAANAFGIPHEMLSAAQVRARWPAFNMHDSEFAYFEPSAGFVRPEACVAAQLQLARAHGAKIRASETVLGFQPSGDTVVLTTNKARYEASRLILAAGAWLPQILPAFAPLFKIYRQTQFWFAVDDPAAFAPARFPVFIWELRNSRRGIYGFPAIDGAAAIKIASEEFAGTTTAETVREISQAEIDAVYRLLAPHLSGVTPHCLRATACLYTVTPDFGFVIDTHPDSERILIASACSGHGFKHSPAIGEILADMALGLRPKFDLAPFRLRRLS
ncbi:MAG TPA: N-methyl-L-tryptophan oxidase, partial [Rhizomicrobium sp.]